MMLKLPGRAIVLLICFNTGVRGQDSHHIDSIFKALDKGNVTISTGAVNFSDLAMVEKGDTLVYALGENVEGMYLGYAFVERLASNTDMLKINDKYYRLFADGKDDKLFDLDVKRAGLYHISTRNKKYICITGRNTHISNDASYLSGFTVIDVTERNKIKVYEMLSYSSSIYSLGDFNGDGVLDFLRMKRHAGGADKFIVTLRSLNGETLPIGEKGYFMVLSGYNPFFIASKYWD